MATSPHIRTGHTEPTTRCRALLRKVALSAIGSSLLVATLGLAPAGAEARSGQARTSESTSFTEDSDTNDGGTPNNVEDDGDNRRPSGRDRSVEQGGSGNQGASTSDPDDDGSGPDRSNGGPDQPNGSGGVDLADQDGTRGNGTAVIAVDADCHTVTVTSSKDISNVVTFTDGTSLKFDGLTGHTWTTSFTATVVSATAKSATTSVTHMAGSCGIDDVAGATSDAAGTADEHDECTAGAMDDTCDEAKPETRSADSTERSTGVPAGFECPKADDMDDDGGDDDGEDIFSTICQLIAGDDADSAAEAGTVSARSAGGSILASLPVVGSVVDGQLPMTGISTLSFLIVAMAAMAIGFLLVRATRRTKAGATS